MKRKTDYIATLGLSAVAAGTAAAMQFGMPLIGCDIKGNISMNTGEKIYHVKGQFYYNDTVVNLDKGEMWFCSEADARKAGWRKSKN